MNNDHQFDFMTKNPQTPPEGPPAERSESEDVDRMAPLAHRMRPRSLEQFVGHFEVLGAGKPLRQWIETDRVPSLVFWGPPGCGKTTLARLIARRTQQHFEKLSAVHAGVKDIKSVVEGARFRRQSSNRRTILFVDEIHRFNKSQQDSLLPHVEAGLLTLIGATTENPSFEINSALLSRVRVIRLEQLRNEDLMHIVEQAIRSPVGLGGFFEIEPRGIEWIASRAEGDARRALTTLEQISLAVTDTSQPLDLEKIQTTLAGGLDRQPLPYDKNGEEHYNVISAFIKSIRDSDPHAGLYYLARMLEAGEDPKFIARRMIILASEDIGNADPRALQIAIAVKEAVHFVGMPEARINLAQGVTYLCAAPKSNASYVGVDAAISKVKETGALPVPMHLRNAVTGLMKKQGYGKNYQYAHSQEDQRAGQFHLPDAIRGTRFYFPKDVGLEKQIKSRLDQIQNDFD